MNHQQPNSKAFLGQKKVPKVNILDRSHVLNNITDLYTDVVEFCMAVDKKNLYTADASKECLTAWANYYKNTNATD